MAKVLVVEDNPLDYKMISDPLIDGYELDHAGFSSRDAGRCGHASGTA